MTFMDIVWKLLRQNKGRYLLFGVSVCFAVAMAGTYGILLFSPMITGALMTDGSTYMISLGMYLITLAGIFSFLFYANGIYMQSVRKETGIFLALGLYPKAVAGMERRQYDICFLAGGAMGLFLSIPLSFGAWKFLTLFITYTDKHFRIGWKGLLIAVCVWGITWLGLQIKNSVSLSRIDVVEALKGESVSEDVKGAHPGLGMVGLAMIPLGIILFNITAVSAELKKFSTLFLGVSLVGVYLMTAQITTVGTIMKRVLPSNYLKNLLFYNLVRQKGKQYTLALFVSSILIAVTVFSICFNGSGFLESYYRVQEDPYDFAVLTGGRQGRLEEAVIRNAAAKDGVTITDFTVLHLLAIGREHQYRDEEMNEWSTDYAVSVSEFNRFAGQKLHVPDDGYVYFQDSDDSMFLTCQEDIGNFYNPTTKEDFQLRKEQLLSREDILNNSAQLDSLLILSDSTWKSLSDATDYSFKWDYYLFRGEGLENSSSLQNDLLNKIIALSHGKMLMNPDQQAVKDKMDDYQDEILDYEGNELEAARSWQCYPYARETQIAIQKETGAIYLLLIFFIALISFTSATMIIALKITGTIRQDAGSYRRAVYLGLREKELSKLIEKQMALVFFFPSICGCMAALFMINRFLSVSSITHYRAVTWAAAGLSFAVFLIQVIVFCVVRKKLIERTMKAVEM